MFEKKVLERLYQRAEAPEDLPWHSVDPAKLLVEVVGQKDKPGRALDLGCGTGVYSVYLARQGYEVTGLDFIPKALQMAKERGQVEKVKVNWIATDLLEWKSTERFDLILDSGTLHTITAEKMSRYKEQLLSWLADDGDFILAHWGRRHLLDWRPVGPRRRTRLEILQFLGPELREQAYQSELVSGLPLLIGPHALTQSFWFQRSVTPILSN
jgi:SAM-dependent methyltransferase